MSLDEYLFGKVAGFLKKRNACKNDNINKTVFLEQHKQRFTILARAITGCPIELFMSEREGGYKANNFFLPQSISMFDTYTDNENYYFFRIL